MSATPSSIIFIFFMVLGICKGVLAATFTLVNKCEFTVWPGILGNAGSARFDSTGFELGSGGSRAFQAPAKWSGRIWGRTGCRFDGSGGGGNCTTADCGPSVECNGAGAIPPATLAEFTIGSGGGKDFYDVSLVDGYNLPIKVEAVGGLGACGSTGCAADLNRICPNELRAKDGLACKSACGAFAKPEYCCSGAYSSPATCKPSVYSRMFKTACPTSYTYAYDDATSTFTCTGANYVLTFCPSITKPPPLPPPPVSAGTSNGPPVDAGALNGPPVANATLNAPPVETGISNGPPAANETTKDPESDPGLMPEGNQYDSLWLPDFLTGDSSPTISCFAMHSRSPISSAIAIVILSFLH
ncbi:PREDICTED: pathogenesis-related protein 5-like [Ipomoea nil]|uniref:pathogenesis-related protein 5-like n=1 Tax=Ipomoea nil TaxID=35883 RepID=UPI000900B9E4|nr:PREDICTED: pathogenesis-related protein 5-like [Ipomoea nil]